MKDIPRSEWRQFLEGFGFRHRAWLASVDEGGNTRVRDRPLAGLQAEEDTISIRFADRTDAVQLKARALRVQESARGEEVGLDLATERGVTRLRFRAPALPEEVDGLAPAER